jgi:PTS system nitrogen regulatory IIA component
MKIEELIAQDRASVGLRVADKARAISELAGEAAAALQWDAEAIITELQKREALGSTGIGLGVAIPHARLASLARPYGSIVKLRKPIEFEAVDGKPVDIIVLLLLPADAPSEQLNALACVARTLRDEGRLRRLRSATDGAELFRELVRE